MIRLISVLYTDDKPMRPTDAEFGVKIDFVRGQSDPVKVFSAMTDMLTAFAEMDRVLIGSVAPGSEPFSVIEDVEAASITTWLRNRLASIDDQALKEFDPKQQIGAYAVRAKYRVIQFLEDKEAANTKARLAQLRRDLEQLAAPVAGHLLPPHIDVERLVPPMNQIQGAKAKLTRGETVTLRSDYAPDWQVDVESSEPVETLGDLLAVEQTDGQMDMFLLIKKPDFLGKSQWEFRHGSTPLFAGIKDELWLERFHRGEEQIVPGSLMRATVNYTYGYDATGTLMDAHYEVAKVHRIVPPSKLLQDEMFH